MVLFLAKVTVREFGVISSSPLNIITLSLEPTHLWTSNYRKRLVSGMAQFHNHSAAINEVTLPIFDRT